MQDQGSFTTFRFDPFDPDYEQFPKARAATMYATTVEPGEILWIPPLWVHCIVNEPEAAAGGWFDSGGTSYALAMVFNYHDTCAPRLSAPAPIR
jgi:hypothetical protein